MPLSNEVRRLSSTWGTGTGWPKRLHWMEIQGIRGWTGQRFEMRFPIMAVVGENGVGKSTVLQCAASLYGAPRGSKERYASDFFPETPWDQVRNAEIRCEVREGDSSRRFSVTKPTGRWRGNPQRPERNVVYIDLSRIQPVPARVGYRTLANATYKEVDATEFEKSRLARFSAIMGRTYDLAKMALTDADAKRFVPVISHKGAEYSGFHQGAGETTIAELLQEDLPQYSLVLIDEVESSLHPRAQRRLIRDLADKCRSLQLQVVLTTHSPYVLEELPLEARAYILQTSTSRRQVVYGVSPEFAMTKMDDVQHHECDIYAEDRRAATLVMEILATYRKDIAPRCRTVPYGASSVGRALGEMVAARRFPNASCVFLDGDQGKAPGCENLPGEDAPERVVFTALRDRGWASLAMRVGRDYSQTVDACNQAMTLGDHHEWVQHAATTLTMGGDYLWQAACAEWATICLDAEAAEGVVQPIEDALNSFEPERVPSERPVEAVAVASPSAPDRQPPPSPNEPQQLF